MEEENIMNSKVSGYLEKKGKMKMMSSYKKYWFVLEGRLLLYYRSKDEYEAISPCKGSINLGPPCNVKPCPAQPGVFQIETRTSTITLRAEDREEQNRWMQGIMSALNPNKNAVKLSHFRYSLDELPQQQVNRDKLQNKKNSLPPSMSSSKDQSNEEIIQRLQKMGAQSYGGSVGTINQIVNSKKSDSTNNSNSEESLQYNPMGFDTPRTSVLIENDQYEAIKKSVASDSVQIRREMKPVVENIYERISRDSPTLTSQNTEVDYSVPYKKTEYKEKNQLPNCQTSDVYDDSILRKIIENRSSEMEDLDRSPTFLVENEAYGATQTITTQKDKGDTNRGSFVLENDNYCSIDKMRRYSNEASEVIYAEPKCTEITDHNENNLVLGNNQDWTKTEENAYSVSKIYDSSKNVTIDVPIEYEDLDRFGEYTEPKYQTTEEIYAECTEKAKKKSKKEKKKKHCKDDLGNEKKEMKLKKTSSFIKRVWKKKYKHKEKEENIEELYEAVPSTTVEKVSINDETAMQMLSELHNILEHKKPILKERLSTEVKCDKNADEKQKAKKITTNINVCGSPPRDETAVQMLCELQSILENKKPILTGRVSGDKDFLTTSPKSEKNFVLNENESKITQNVNVEGASSSAGSEKLQPMLPAKQPKTGLDSPYHDVPKNNKPITKMLPPKRKQNFENVKSLDEILDDLDKAKNEDFSKNKIKKLIKQFSESEFSENDVVLRTNKASDHFREEMDTDELSKLLDELAKVTCAPILTPGVTSSLISPHLTDEELLKLLPTRRRRYSEPDYDIPRPHKSLTNLPKKESPLEGVIGSTRFFGPILKPSDINVKTNRMNSSAEVPGMTPDSLEVETHATCPHHSHVPEDERTSYTSHNYIQLKHQNTSNIGNDDCIKKKNLMANIENSVKYFDNILIENDIYAQPKSLHNVNTTKGFRIDDFNHDTFSKSTKTKDTNLDEDKQQEAFIDSLET